MPTLTHKPALDIVSDRAIDETSDERFDRGAFARRAIDLLDPPRMTVAICEGAARMRVEWGPIWGRRDDKWALLAIPAHASKRSITLAIAHLASPSRAYALDVLMDEAPREAVSTARTRTHDPPAA
jgi:hypothetical protein